MTYFSETDHYNIVNKSAMKMLPPEILSVEAGYNQPNLKGMILALDRKISDLKDNASSFENPDFASHLELKKLEDKLLQLSVMINE